MFFTWVQFVSGMELIFFLYLVNEEYNIRCSSLRQQTKHIIENKQFTIKKKDHLNRVNGICFFLSFQ